MTAERSTAPEKGSGAPWGWYEAIGLVLVSHFVLIVSGSIAVSGRGPDAPPTPVATQFWASTPFWATIIVGAWWVAGRGSSLVDVRAALGISLRSVDVVIGVAVGVATQLVLLPALYWPIHRLGGTDRDDLERLARDLVDTADGVVGVTLLVLMTCVFAPVCEELLYRAVVLRGVGRDSWALGVGVASVVFGLAHLQGLQLPGLIVLGLIAGVLVWRTGRIGAAVLAHVAFNATTVVVLLAER